MEQKIISQREFAGRHGVSEKSIHDGIKNSKNYGVTLKTASIGKINSDEGLIINYLKHRMKVFRFFRNNLS